jgi:hypothetical protein
MAFSRKIKLFTKSKRHVIIMMSQSRDIVLLRAAVAQKR